jgi:hypothetical protein
MGAFSNGTHGLTYEEEYCYRCVNHGDHDNLDDPGCWIWAQHTLHNDHDMNDPGSILHVLIPRGLKGENLKCVMFREKQSP